MTDSQIAVDETRENAVGSSLLMVINIFVANVAGYTANWLLARQLSPPEFAEFTLIATIQTSLAFLTLATMLGVAKYTTIKRAQGDMTALTSMRNWLLPRSLLVGVILSLLLVGGASILRDIFQTQSVVMFSLLALCMPVFILSSVERGILQGLLRFDLYAVSLQTEVWVKFGGLAAVAFLGLGADGAALVLSLAIIGGWVTAFCTRRLAFASVSITPPVPFAEFSLLRQGYLALIIVNFSQVIINNSDMLLVKALFPAIAVGQYAVIALLGRIIFYGTWAISLTIFPLVAHRQARGEPHRNLFYGALGIVGIGSLGATVIIAIFPTQIIATIFGVQYLAIAPLLWLYALATSLYALANVIINYHISLGNSMGSYFVLGAGTLQIGGIILFHHTLVEVIMVQVVVMGTLLLGLMIWHFAMTYYHNQSPVIDSNN